MVATPVTDTAPAAAAQTDWDRLATRAKIRRNTSQALLIGFLLITSLPVLLPYFWMLTISFSARRAVSNRCCGKPAGCLCQPSLPSA